MTTNRCRKMAQSPGSNTGGYEDQKTGQADTLHLGLIAAAGAATMGYGVYEYRTEVRNALSRLRAKFIPASSGD